MDEKRQQVALTTQTGAQGLSALLGLDDSAAAEWQDVDLSAMLQHQLAAPLQSDLGGENGTAQAALNQAAEQGATTLNELFQSTTPPLHVLSLAKDFFKAASGEGTLRTPFQRLSYLIYIVCILAARVRLGQKITKLPDDKLLQGVCWAERQEWAIASTRLLLAEGRRVLEHSVTAPP